MNKARYYKVKEIFSDAVEMPLEKRDAFLMERCRDDVELFEEINSLLAEHYREESLIEEHSFNLDSFMAKGKNYEGRQFGNYKILREIGVGGMGAVFLAERSDGEFDQQVAIKIVRQTIVSSDLERHFRRERQILASLNHPNIARLLDGGVSENDEPFFVMEYVDGKPLNLFAEQLSLEDKLKLFIKVCNAVAFAHRNLVVHRDLKPSNILVEKDGEPKLLDFGLAKIEDEGLNADATQSNFRALTPAYASPEQLRGGTVTTATDVYSLGVVLYELLTGEKPFSFDDKNLEEILKTITDTEPKPPSVAVASNPPDPKLKGDLDNVVLMALRKEPDRRYISAAALAHDIERYLNKQPISARPSTFRYRTSKFIQRNRIAVAAAALILLAVFVGTSVAAVQYRRAQAERAKAEKVNNFLKKMLLTGNPRSQKSGYSVSVNEMLEQAAQRLDSGELDSVPSVKAELAATLGNTYLNQGQYDASERYLKMALPLSEQVYGKESFQTASVNIVLGNLALSRSRYDEAAAFYEPNVLIIRSAFEKNEYPAETFTALLGSLALLKRARGDSAGAEKLYRESLEIARQRSIDAGFSETMLSLTLFDQGKFDEAEATVRKLVTVSRQDLDEALGLANELTLLGSILSEKGNLNEAQGSLLEAEKIYRKVYSPNNIAIFDNLRLQAQVSYLNGNYSEAKTRIDQVLENYRANTTTKYISYATALTLDGLILSKLKKTAEAETQLREAFRLRQENLPPGHFMTALTESALGQYLVSQGRGEEGKIHLQASYESLRTSQGEQNARTIAVFGQLQNLSAARP